MRIYLVSGSCAHSWQDYFGFFSRTDNVDAFLEPITYSGVKSFVTNVLDVLLLSGTRWETIQDGTLYFIYIGRVLMDKCVNGIVSRYWHAQDSNHNSEWLNEKRV